ncbi:unnamed protein product [Caenorhabditis sp. 36 PRJEB53466]|nr:unnamed protein product [Caenorhabditis sp. 36 PRJEB53466]
MSISNKVASMFRRERRDSETSTDSWSLVEEDDDFSLNSTEAEEEDENEEKSAEPIVEEPPTSDDDTASEHSDSESDPDSEDSESDVSDESDLEAEQEVEESIESDEDSDLEIQEESESEGEEEMTDSDKEAARKCKEEDWEHEIEQQEEEECDELHPRPFGRIALCISLFVLLFPVADVFTSWVLTYQARLAEPFDVCKGHSPQRYDRLSRFRLLSRWEPLERLEKQFKEEPLTIECLDERVGPYKPPNIENTPPPFPPVTNEYVNVFDEPYKPPKIDDDEPAPLINIFDEPYKPPKIDNKPAIPDPRLAETLTLCAWANSGLPNITDRTKYYPCWTTFSDYNAPKSSSSAALAPIPPAPFTPRKKVDSFVPRHQPCLVHVNESRWSCQRKKMVPSVIRNHLAYTPAAVYKGKTKSRGKSGEKFNKKEKKPEICGKKASESMRTMPKPTDQCESRHFSKFTPRRKHIGYKAPLPCKAPNYRPTTPKPARKPSQPYDDWFLKRSEIRAQLRHKA